MSQNGYYNKPTRELWFDILKESNPQIDFTIDQYRLIDFAENDDGDVSRNTKGVLEGIPEMGRTGQVLLTWNRPDIGKNFVNREIYIPNYETILYKRDILPIFNDREKYQLIPADIYDGQLGIIKPGDKIEIRMRENNSCFVGKITVTIGNPRLALGRLIVNRRLDGLDYPTNQPDKIQGPVLYWPEDFSSVYQHLEKQKLGGVVTAEFLSFFHTVVEEPWVINDLPAEFNLKAATFHYIGKTTDCVLPCNHNFTNVMVIKLVDNVCTNVASHILLHYNLPKA